MILHVRMEALSIPLPNVCLALRFHWKGMVVISLALGTRWKYKGYSAATPYVDGEWVLEKKAFVNVNRDKIVHATYHTTGNLLVLGVSSQPRS